MTTWSTKTKISINLVAPNSPNQPLVSGNRSFTLFCSIEIALQNGHLKQHLLLQTRFPRCSVFPFFSSFDLGLGSKSRLKFWNPYFYNAFGSGISAFVGVNVQNVRFVNFMADHQFQMPAQAKAVPPRCVLSWHEASQTCQAGWCWTYSKRAGVLVLQQAPCQSLYGALSTKAQKSQHPFAWGLLVTGSKELQSLTSFLSIPKASLG